MNWYPIGPDFVFAPWDIGFARLSRRNEQGRQGMVLDIAVDPNDQATIYAVVAPAMGWIYPFYGGTAAFRSRDGGWSWDCITDSLQTNHGQAVNATCIAVNPDPTQSGVIYMGVTSGPGSTGAQAGIVVSQDGGDTWGLFQPLPQGPGSVSKLIVDPNTTSTPATTAIFAATNSGLFCSGSSGATSTWNPLQGGNVMSLVAYMPPPGAGQYTFYAGIESVGLFYTNTPTNAASWVNLNQMGVGLPQAGFDAVLADLCPQNPDRVYLYLVTSGSGSLYTSNSSLTSWTQVQSTNLPGPTSGNYDLCFAVAPNSKGDGSSDVLLFGSLLVSRSIDAGDNWQTDAAAFHADTHAFAFSPDPSFFYPQNNPQPGTVPTTYVGCDGGIAQSSGLVDPINLSFGQAPTNYDDNLTYDPFSALWQNSNHGIQGSGIYGYASHPAISALSYICCQDTGIGAGKGALGWRGLVDADGLAIAVAPGSDGVRIWGKMGEFLGSWPEWRITMWIDRGDFAPPAVDSTLGPGGPLLYGKTDHHMAVGLDNKCLTGVRVHDSDRTLSLPITATGLQTATPASMNGIVIGRTLIIDPGTSHEETVQVRATTGTTFTATFKNTHLAGENIQLERSFVARIGQDSIADQISQDFVSHAVAGVAASPLDPDVLYCFTDDQRLWITNGASSASISTVWTEITGNKPTALNISSVAIDNSGNVYVLLLNPITVGSGTSSYTTPLFQISGGQWVPQQCSSTLPTAVNNPFFLNLLADPVQTAVLYASFVDRVFEVTLSGSAWQWQEITGNLPPGEVIFDLWVGNIAPAPTSPKVILRAALPSRGVWELPLSPGEGAPAFALYLRDNVLDQGWLSISPDYPTPDPFLSGQTIGHWQCADIKVDAQQGSGSTPFFQTDPEYTLPISNVAFDMIADNSQHLPQNNQALVHVQVHNRSNQPLRNATVWAIYANASAGVPALSKSALQPAFDFWSQFHASGNIIPALPADSPWRAVSQPTTVNNVAAIHPQIASFYWMVPQLDLVDPGHYCIVAFVHTKPVNGIGSVVPPTNAPYERDSVDDIVPVNRQVGQKNLHINSLPGPDLLEYVEFHNASARPRNPDLVFDFREIPPVFDIFFRLTETEGEVRLQGAVPLAPASSPPFRRGPIHSRGLPNFAPKVYRANPMSLVEVQGVRLGPSEWVAAQLLIRSSRPPSKGPDLHFQVMQRVSGRVVVGGSTYILRRPK